MGAPAAAGADHGAGPPAGFWARWTSGEAYTAPLLSRSGVLAIQLLRDQLDLAVGAAVRASGDAGLLIQGLSMDVGAADAEAVEVLGRHLGRRAARYVAFRAGSSHMGGTCPFDSGAGRGQAACAGDAGTFHSERLIRACQESSRWTPTMTSDATSSTAACVDVSPR